MDNQVPIPKEATELNEKVAEQNVAEQPQVKINVVGNPETWVLIHQIAREDGLFVKETKAMEVLGVGVLVNITSQINGVISETSSFIPNARIASKKLDNNVMLYSIVFGNSLTLNIG